MMDMTTFIGLDPEAKNEADLDTFEAFIDELLVMEDKRQAAGHLRQMKATDPAKFLTYVSSHRIEGGVFGGKLSKLAQRLHDTIHEMNEEDKIANAIPLEQRVKDAHLARSKGSTPYSSGGNNTHVW